MQVQVETYVDEGGVEKLRRIRFDSRQIEIAENIDQWHGADYRYFKVRGSDGNVYIFRHNEIRTDWELTLYERTQLQGDPAIRSNGTDLPIPRCSDDPPHAPWPASCDSWRSNLTASLNFRIPAESISRIPYETDRAGECGPP